MWLKLQTYYRFIDRPGRPIYLALLFNDFWSWKRSKNKCIKLVKFVSYFYLMFPILSVDRRSLFKIYSCLARFIQFSSTRGGIYILWNYWKNFDNWWKIWYKIEIILFSGYVSRVNGTIKDQRAWKRWLDGVNGRLRLRTGEIDKISRASNENAIILGRPEIKISITPISKRRES